ncbi:hypothetical protein SY83_02960 [Paenibacillus swuensis]|uniref:Stress protein n=1 Tax=Paenibacillus swuensis TaxID=1178515 RepID=A0A172TER8_9BACL|nr:hypothetical protein [Paenibacillus swuensis]ANE45452.1 hypothetical protein SY83_02960 [Paenibacillus swuensis]
MTKWILALSMLLMFTTACNNDSAAKVHTVGDVEKAFRQVGLVITKDASVTERPLGEITPQGYSLGSNAAVNVYLYKDSKTREEGFKAYEDSPKIMSSHAPIVYFTDNVLVLYNYAEVPNTAVAKTDETRFGKQLENAIKDL